MPGDGPKPGPGDPSPGDTGLADASPGAVSPFLRNLLLFGRALRSAGLEVSLEQILGFARALEWIDIGSRKQVFHAARALLVSRCEDLRLFGIVFDRFWLGIAEPPADRSKRGAGSGSATWPAPRGPRTPASRWPTARRRTAPRRSCGGATSPA